MANYTTVAKTNRLLAVRDLIDSNTANGRIVIGSAGMAQIIAVVDITKGSTIGSNTLILMPTAKSNTAIASNTANAARIESGNGMVILTNLTVHTSGADVTIDNVTVNSGQTITVNSANVVHAV